MIENTKKHTFTLRINDIINLFLGFDSDGNAVAALGQSRQRGVQRAQRSERDKLADLQSRRLVGDHTKRRGLVKGTSCIRAENAYSRYNE